MSDKRSLLFYGELPPEAIHGIACSNIINLRMLESNFEIVIIKEISTLRSKGLIAVKKIFKKVRTIA